MTETQISVESDIPMLAPGDIVVIDGRTLLVAEVDGPNCTLTISRIPWWRRALRWAAARLRRWRHRDG